jgi:hypothetical protein
MSRHHPYPRPTATPTPSWSTAPWVAALWRSLVNITGLDYWFRLPNGRTFSITKHLKRTFQLSGALAMTALTTYSLSNWIQWKTYNISPPWNFFGSYFHSLVLITMGVISSGYFMYGFGSKLLFEADGYHTYLSNKYIGSSYDL